MNRISREEMLMAYAFVAARRSACCRLAVGVIIAKEARVISTGYVGPPPGEPDCEEAGCDITAPCTRSLHAERNAITFARKYAIQISGCNMYCTDSPCLGCATLIVGAGIARVFYAREYRRPEGLAYLSRFDIPAIHLVYNFPDWGLADAS